MRYLSFADLSRREAVHDIQQAYGGTYTKVRRGGVERMAYIRGIHDDGFVEYCSISPNGNRNNSRLVEWPEIEFAATPPPMGVFNIKASDDVLEGHSVVVSRMLNRNWKRGVHMERVRMSAIDDTMDPFGWSPDAVANSIFNPIWPEPAEMLDRGWQRRRFNHFQHSIAISPELSLQVVDNNFRFVMLYWFSTAIGAVNLEEDRAALLAEYEYMLPKVQDYFGEAYVA